MDQVSIVRRALVPATAGLATWFVAWAAYNLGPGLPAWLHGPVAFVSGLLMFFGIFLSGFVVWPLARLRGASVMEAALAALLTPFAWATKEVIRLTISFTVPEALYYYVSPLALVAYLGAIGAMGFSELAVRRTRRKRGDDVSGPFVVPLVVGLAALVAIVLLFGRTMGEETFYIWLVGFRAMFGAGMGV